MEISIVQIGKMLYLVLFVGFGLFFAYNHFQEGDMVWMIAFLLASVIPCILIVKEWKAIKEANAHNNESSK